MRNPRNNKREPSFTVSQIVEIVNRKDISIVSFDLFDTLLVRPSVNPKDIFSLLQTTTKEKYGVDFQLMRYYAEDEMQDEYATLHEIWNHIAQRHNLSSDVACELEKLEMELECDMLTVRRDTKQIYDAAVKSGKKIIVTSDMYLPSSFLMAVLKKKGFDKVSKVYVSCEETARKSAGKLYDVVIKKEGLECPAELLHIGDNFQSDYKVPIERGITAVYYPSVWDLTLFSDCPWGRPVRVTKAFDNPTMRVLLSFAFLHAWNKDDSLLYGVKRIPSIGAFADILLAPFATSLAIEMLCNNEVQNNYSTMLFAARDGYLPQKIYDIVGKNRNHIPSKYLYVSRQALCFTTFKSFKDYLEQSKWDEEYSLGQFISGFVVDARLREQILTSLSESVQKTNMHSDPKIIIDILDPFMNELEAYYMEERKLATAYYSTVFGAKQGRQIVFDCGYSGSVSTGLQKAINLPIDKFYIWETATNREMDETNGTRTYCFLNCPISYGINILHEECFSPLEGSCIGFTSKNGLAEPVLEHLDISEEMRTAVNTIDENCILYALDFEKTFGKYLLDLQCHNCRAFVRLMKYALVESPYNELAVFDSIIYPDSHMGTQRLSKKIYKAFEDLNQYRYSFQGTMFQNPLNILEKESILRKPSKTYKIGIHLHLYNKYLMEEFLGYFKTITYPFDLYITITDEAFAPVLYRLYNPAQISALQKLVVVQTKNRGRDVAPWLVGIQPYQNQYDLFCHVHGKKSVQYGGNHGDRWRRYLLDNLIDGAALEEILTLFENEKDLGVLFPDCYSEIKRIHNTHNIPVYGNYGEEKIIADLLNRMGITERFSRDNTLWSMGTMMWYRPEALAPLFSIGLQYEDFPEEPIAIGGTIAHAIERLPAIVAKSRGYETKRFNHRPETDIPTSIQGLVNQYTERYVEIAQRIGVEGAKKVVSYAYRIWLQKNLHLIKKAEIPASSGDILHDLARRLGIKNAKTVLQEAKTFKDEKRR